MAHATADLLGQSGSIGNRGSEEEQPMDHQGHDMAHGGQDTGDQGHGGHAARGAPTTEHGTQAGHIDHTGHEAMFRRRFWVSTLLSVPVLLFSPFIQQTLGFRTPEFPGSSWITPLFAVVVFGYGGAALPPPAGSGGRPPRPAPKVV